MKRTQKQTKKTIPKWLAIFGLTFIFGLIYLLVANAKETMPVLVVALVFMEASRIFIEG